MNESTDGAKHPTTHPPTIGEETGGAGAAVFRCNETLTKYLKPILWKIQFINKIYVFIRNYYKLLVFQHLSPEVHSLNHSDWGETPHESNFLLPPPNTFLNCVFRCFKVGRLLTKEILKVLRTFRPKSSPIVTLIIPSPILHLWWFILNYSKPIVDC